VDQGKNAERSEHIKKKLLSMYHQFMQLANLDITKEPMKSVRRRTTLWVAHAWTPKLKCPTCLAFAVTFAREHDAGQINDGQIEEAALEALERFERVAKAAGNAEGPYQMQIDLQEMMQSLVGIVRRKEEMVRALDGLGKLWKRSQNVAVRGHREYNPGWHTAIDLKHLLTVSEAITRSALERKESRGGHFRDDFPNKDAAGGKMNIVLRKDVDGSMRVRREPIPERFSKSGAATRTAETSWSKSRKFPRAWSCSTPSTRFKRRRPMTSPAGGIAKLANAVPAQRKLMACRSSCA
jgi:succinate dehydrogenase flavoprotein subunit